VNAGRALRGTTGRSNANAFANSPCLADRGEKAVSETLKAVHVLLERFIVVAEVDPQHRAYVPSSDSDLQFVGPIAPIRGSRDECGLVIGSFTDSDARACANSDGSSRKRRVTNAPTASSAGSSTQRHLSPARGP
jgi:hypothetical protein